MSSPSTKGDKRSLCCASQTRKNRPAEGELVPSPRCGAVKPSAPTGPGHSGSILANWASSPRARGPLIAYSLPATFATKAATLVAFAPSTMSGGIVPCPKQVCEEPEGGL